MRVWEKIYIGTLVVFLIILNLCIGTAFYLSYSNSLKTEKDTAYSQWNSIYRAFAEDVKAMEEGNRLSESSISELFQKYGIQYYSSGVKLELWTKEQLEDDLEIEMVPYSYYDVEGNEEGYQIPGKKYSTMLQNVGYYPRIVVMDIENQKQIAVAGRLEAGETAYIVAMRKELVGFKEVWIKMIMIFALIELVASFVLAVILYFFLKKVLHPLEALAQAADSIAGGSLTQTVEVKGKDEIACLAESFNHMAREISQTVEELSEETKNKQQFIDDLAHEIRTPLTTIQGYSQLLQNVVLPEEKRVQYLSYIMNESKRIQVMSDDLLKLTLMKREQFQFGWFRNTEFIKKTVEPMQDLAATKNIRISIETDGKKSYGHQTLLENVMVNLLKNAMNACGDGGKISAGVYENHFIVRDNGIGMSEECRDKLFEPYYREDKARSRAAFGAGLGLTICKEIIDKHKGGIIVTSKKNEGTVIEIILPAENLTTS